MQRKEERIDEVLRDNELADSGELPWTTLHDRRACLRRSDSKSKMSSAFSSRALSVGVLITLHYSRFSTIRPARLILGWVTVGGFESRSH